MALSLRKLALTLVLTALVAAPAVIRPPVVKAQDAPADGVWLAGDLHVHTPYSHDSYGGPDDDNTGAEEFYLLGNTVQGNFESAGRRGLDYLAITDHNDVRSQSDPGFGASGVIPIPGYENSLSGHAQMLGATKVYDNGDRSAAAVQSLADTLRADGGVFQINHPAEGSTDYPHDVDWALGYEVEPNTVEVWNISRLWQPPAPSASSNDDAVRYWEGWLDRGARVTATGGSDSHYIWTSNLLLGSPTTWVYAENRSSEAILAGIRAGRTFISHQPPTLNGPRIFLEGDGDGDGGFESMVGDAVAPGSALRVRVLDAPGSFLRVVTDGGREAFEPVPVTAPDFEHSFSLPEDATWVRAEIFDPDAAAERATACDAPFGSQTTYCRNQLAILGMTSAMYFDVEQVATSLDYTGDTSGRGDTVSLSATLSDVTGAALAEQEVTFSFAGRTVTALTDGSGVARTTATVAEHGRSLEIETSYAGSARYLPSSDTATITWGRTR